MKRFLLLFIIAIATFLLFALFKNPDILDDIWLWLIGFAGLIIKGGKSIFDYLKSLFDKNDQENSQQTSTPITNTNTISSPVTPVQLDPSTIQITLLRYQDDGQTTLGLLYINNKFYCYTLEDTFRKVKIPGETRISSGTYKVDFRKEVTELTKKYQERYEWFSYHFQLYDVPGFQSIYIHNGGDHTHTEGCILVSDSMNVSKEATQLSNSRNTFKQLYVFLEKHLLAGKELTITIKDEGWVGELPIQ